MIWHADYKQLEWLYEDWRDGIRLPNANPEKVDRIASLRFLEYNSRQVSMKSWRSGAGMRKVVAERKVLVYAILRQLPDPKGRCCMLHLAIPCALCLPCVMHYMWESYIHYCA